MECKVRTCDCGHFRSFYWNISRMECKETAAGRLVMTESIGIYPEWNVKYSSKNRLSNFLSIGIYPEWNVK